METPPAKEDHLEWFPAPRSYSQVPPSKVSLRFTFFLPMQFTTKSPVEDLLPAHFTNLNSLTVLFAPSPSNTTCIRPMSMHSFLGTRDIFFLPLPSNLSHTTNQNTATNTLLFQPVSILRTFFSDYFHFCSGFSFSWISISSVLVDDVGILRLDTPKFWPICLSSLLLKILQNCNL